MCYKMHEEVESDPDVMNEDDELGINLLTSGLCVQMCCWWTCSHTILCGLSIIILKSCGLICGILDLFVV